MKNGVEYSAGTAPERASSIRCRTLSIRHVRRPLVLCTAPSKSWRSFACHLLCQQKYSEFHSLDQMVWLPDITDHWIYHITCFLIANTLIDSIYVLCTVCRWNDDTFQYWWWWCQLEHIFNTLTCASVAILSSRVTRCFKSATSELIDSFSMETNFWVQVFTSLYKTVIRVVLALFLFINVSYWLDLATARDSGSAGDFSLNNIDKLFPCN